jgi:hypothetical protein
MEDEEGMIYTSSSYSDDDNEYGLEEKNEDEEGKAHIGGGYGSSYSYTP